MYEKLSSFCGMCKTCEYHSRTDRHPLSQRRLQVSGRQHPRGPHLNDCREQDRRKGRNGQGGCEPD